MTTSAEPGRKAPYSNDLRWRIVWQWFGMGLSLRKIAENLNVALGTTYNICKLFEDTGSICASIHNENKHIFNDR